MYNNSRVKLKVKVLRYNGKDKVVAPHLTVYELVENAVYFRYCNNKEYDEDQLNEMVEVILKKGNVYFVYRLINLDILIYKQKHYASVADNILKLIMQKDKPLQQIDIEIFARLGLKEQAKFLENKKKTNNKK